MRAPAIRLLAPQRRSLARALSKDLPLKAAAVGLAVALYVLAALVIPREVVVAFDGRVPIDPPEAPAGYAVRGALGDVAVRLRGPEPAVSRVGHEQLRATLDVSALDRTTAEPQQAPVRVTVADAQVAVVDVTPATVPVRIEPVVTTPFTVQARFANEPPAGFRRGDVQVTPAEVSVRGAASLVASVAAVFASVRFGDVGVDVVSSAAPVAVDASGTAIDGVTVEPAAVQVKVAVQSTATTRTLPVLHAIVGAPANGYWVASVSAAPPAVTVRGTREALAGLDLVRTAAVDVSGISATRSYRVGFALPEGVELLEAADALVTVTVQPLTGTRPFPLVAVTVLGVSDGFVAEPDQRTVQATLAGPVPALAALGPEQVTATVDASGKGPGTYVLEVALRTPAGLSVQAVQPQRVTVTIRSRG